MKRNKSKLAMLKAKRRRKAKISPKKSNLVKPEDYIDYKNLPLLVQMLTPHGKMFSRKRSSLGAIHQRQLKLAIKRARFMGLLPYVGD